MTVKRSDTKQSGKKEAAVIGLGNVGGALMVALARMPLVGKVTLVDRDVFERANLLTQNIMPADVGKPKALVAARRLQRINPALAVTAIVDDVANVPLGKLRGDVVACCLDSRRARAVVCSAAWRLGMPMVDSGVSTADGLLLARVTTYVPAKENPCIECAWDEQDYETLEQSHPCDELSADAAPTNSPLSLGMLAASLQAIEMEKCLAGDNAHWARGRQVMIDARNHTHYVTTLRRNPTCRFDHETWDIRPIRLDPGRATLNEVLHLGYRAGMKNGAVSLHVECQSFVTQMQCPRCGHAIEMLGLAGRLSPAQRVCRKCESPMRPVGLDTWDRLEVTRATAGLRKSTLGRLGIRRGDVLTIEDESGRRARMEIGTGRPRATRPNRGVSA